MELFNNNFSSDVSPHVQGMRVLFGSLLLFSVFVSVKFTTWSEECYHVSNEVEFFVGKTTTSTLYMW